MISRFVRLVAALLALAMFTAACGGGSDSGDTVFWWRHRSGGHQLN